MTIDPVLAASAIASAACGLCAVIDAAQRKYTAAVMFGLLAIGNATVFLVLGAQS